MDDSNRICGSGGEGGDVGKEGGLCGGEVGRRIEDVADFLRINAKTCRFFGTMFSGLIPHVEDAGTKMDERGEAGNRLASQTWERFPRKGMDCFIQYQDCVILSFVL